MAHTEITSNSHGSRVAKAIGGAVIGLGLFLAAPFVLFFNEGRAVQTEKSLAEGSSSVRSIKADSVDAKNEGKLVHLSGLATTTETLSDPEFKVSANALKLVREVEMYQWKESKRTEEVKKAGGGSYTVTHYDYDETWSSSHIDSEAFSESYDHQNPAAMKYQSKTLTASNVTLGAFALTPDQVAQIDTAAPLAVEKKPAELKALKAVMNESDLYVGKDPLHPAIGDFKVHFKTVAPQQVTLVAQQKAQTFAPYQTTAGDALLLVRDGNLTSAQMFDAAQADNVAMTWVLRFVGWLMLLVGIALIFRPIAVFGDALPFLGSLAGAGIAVSAFALSTALSLVTIAVAWLFFRPLLGIFLLAVAGGAGFLYLRRVRAKKAAKAASASGNPGEPELRRAA